VKTKITIIIDNPADANAFEAEYPAVAKYASELPALLRLESAKVIAKDDGTPTPAHRTLDLYFNDYAAASRAVGTPQASEFFGRLSAMNATFTGLFLDVQD
jgi:hypothetical protein